MPWIGHILVDDVKTSIGDWTRKRVRWPVRWCHGNWCGSWAASQLFSPSQGSSSTIFMMTLFVTFVDAGSLTAGTHVDQSTLVEWWARSRLDLRCGRLGPCSYYSNNTLVSDCDMLVATWNVRFFTSKIDPITPALLSAQPSVDQRFGMCFV